MLIDRHNTNDTKDTINIRGVNHYYEWIRQPSKESKPVMVFIHGWGGSCRYWRTTAQAISDRFDCLLYDMRGFGQTRENEEANIGYELVDYAEDLLLLLKAFNLEKIYLNAHSMGASIAAVFLNLAPEKIIKAILTCNGIFTYNKLAFSAFHKASSYVVKLRYDWYLKVPFADKMFMARFLNKPISREMSIAFLEDFLLADDSAALNTIYTSVSKNAVEIMPKEFSKIKVPTLLVSGEKDQIIPAPMAIQAAKLNPDYLDYVEIPKTGHFPMLEDSSQYLSIINNFLNSVD